MHFPTYTQTPYPLFLTTHLPFYYNLPAQNNHSLFGFYGISESPTLTTHPYSQEQLDSETKLSPPTQAINFSILPKRELRLEPSPKKQVFKGKAKKGVSGKGRPSREKKGELSQIKLDFGMEWKNENRNIVPNLINQILSFLIKKNKSQALISKLFQRELHPEAYTLSKFYQYMKRIRQSIAHYVDQNVILQFFQIHDPRCQIYDEPEQEFYMRVCRTAISVYLNYEAITVSLASPRIKQTKRKVHLIARRALLKRFLHIARNIGK